MCVHDQLQNSFVATYNNGIRPNMRNARESDMWEQLLEDCAIANYFCRLSTERKSGVALSIKNLMRRNNFAFALDSQGCAITSRARLFLNVDSQAKRESR